MFDAHLHLRDPRLRPHLESLVRRAQAAGVTGWIDCASAPEQWDAPPEGLPESHTAYGLHPWFVEQAPADWLGQLRRHLIAHPRALVGEVGLDGLRAPRDGRQAQRDALVAQLELAETLRRPVILHGAKRWGALFDLLEPWARRLPALLLHRITCSPELLRHPLWKATNLWCSVGAEIANAPSARLRELLLALPRDRLLVETDSPDGLPREGEALAVEDNGRGLNQPSNLAHILQALATILDLPCAEVAALTEQNAAAFLATGRL